MLGMHRRETLKVDGKELQGTQETRQNIHIGMKLEESKVSSDSQK